MIHSAFLNGWNVANTEAINSFFGVTDGVIPNGTLSATSSRSRGLATKAT